MIPIARDAKAITLSDNDDNIYNGLYVGSGGNLAVVTHEETAVKFKNIPDGTFLPIAVKKVLSTDTTASNIVGYKWL